MKRYEITMTGRSPLIMHRDNLDFAERNVKAWTRIPENKALTQAGDDRTPAWTWIGYLYNDKNVVGLDADNIMTLLREGGAKVPFPGKSKETFKKYTCNGLTCDTIQFDLFFGENLDRQCYIKDILSLLDNNNFDEHLRVVEELGFELFVKRAKVGMSKHVRVRPRFNQWRAVGTITVFDEETSCLTRDNLERIFIQCGKLIGVGDWRPGSPKGGYFGLFTPEVREIE